MNYPPSHSVVPHPGNWRVRQQNNATVYEWIPDLIAIARRGSETRLTACPKNGVLWLNFASHNETSPAAR